LPVSHFPTAEIADAMAAAAPEQNAKILIVSADNIGAQVV
jgi:hypothetical protein